MQLKIGGMSIGATDPKQLERIQQGLDPEDEAKGITPKSMPHPDPQTREAITRYVTEHRGMDPTWKPAGSDVELFHNAGYADVNLGHFQQ